MAQFETKIHISISSSLYSDLVKSFYIKFYGSNDIVERETFIGSI